MTECNNSNIFKTVKAVINNEKRNVILAITEYSMKCSKLKPETLDLLEEDNLLDVIFHFANPDIFRKEDVVLYDLSGKVIPKEEENVFVLCDTADTYWRVYKDTVLKHVQVHNFSSLEEYGKAIGCTNFYSRSMDKIEQIGTAYLVSKEKAIQKVHRFCMEFGTPASTAEKYLQCSLSASQIQKLQIGMSVKNSISMGRSYEEAKQLFETALRTFGEKEAKKRYIIDACNAVLEHVSIDVLIDALAILPSQEVIMYKASKCGSSASCLTYTLTEFVKKMAAEKKVAA